MSDEQRTEAGALLRTGLALAEQAPLPDGAKGQIVMATDLHDVYVGVAVRTKRGWRVDAGISAAVRDGRSLKVGGTLRW